jgi:hypothetical protein
MLQIYVYRVWPACIQRWVRWATASMTPCAKISLRHSNASCLHARAWTPTNRHGKRCSPGSKVDTTRTVVTAGSAIARLYATSSFITNKTEPPSLASCPPRAGAVVVRGGPPTGRGQLAALYQRVGTDLFEIQLANCPQKRVTPNVGL